MQCEPARRRLLVAVLAGGLLLVHCASLGPQFDVAQGLDPGPGANSSVVIGKIDIIENNSIGVISLSCFDLVDAATGEVLGRQRFARGRAFAMELLPGEYEIARIRVGHGLTGLMGVFSATGEVHQRFAVEPNEVVYIGDLTYVYTLGFGGAQNSDEIGLSDACAVTAQEIRTQYPQLTGEVTKRLMTPAAALRR